MLGCCVFKNSKTLSASDLQLKRYIISSTYCYIKLLNIFEIYSATRFQNNP